VAHEDEYHDSMVAAIELIWGEGFLAPGGEGNVAKMIESLDARPGDSSDFRRFHDKQILDIGCGTGGPVCTLAGKYGARVVGTDLESNLLRRSQRLARDRELASRVALVQVEPGPLSFRDNAFDVVLSAGAFSQTAAKLALYRECLRVLKPGGWLSTYDWMKTDGEYSDEMLYWFKLEGLTYAMETPERHEELLNEAGFIDVETEDRSAWYRDESLAEYEKVRAEYPRMVELIGEQDADHFTEDWRALSVVCARGEMLQVYSRGRKPCSE